MTAEQSTTGVCKVQHTVPKYSCLEYVCLSTMLCKIS